MTKLQKKQKKVLKSSVYSIGQNSLCNITCYVRKEKSKNQIHKVIGPFINIYHGKCAEFLLHNFYSKKGNSIQNFLSNKCIKNDKNEYMIKNLNEKKCLADICGVYNSTCCLLRVGLSTIPNAGSGVFINSNISKDTYITEYSGDLISAEIFELLSIEEKRYCFRISTNPTKYLKGISTIKDGKGFGSLVNTYPNNNNSTFVVYNKKVYLKTLKDLVNGSELFVSYHADYEKIN